MKATYLPYQLDFKFAAGTSRGVLHHKPSYFLLLQDEEFTGIGECALIPGLSIDPFHLYEQKLEEVCSCLNEGVEPDAIDLKAFPSIAFGLETALLDLKSKGSRLLFPSAFTRHEAGIPINGLVWMGEKDFMRRQIREKIDAGYRCIKMKVGALDFATELELLSDLRKQFPVSEIEIRLDANGAFTAQDAMIKLNELARFDIHSIEQPIRQGQTEAMSKICSESPIPVALDEELIGRMPDEKLLQEINPTYIILKPSLLGGLKVAEEWICLAEKNGIDWWATSALESNIGLNAIAQWTFSTQTERPQGLGTGQLYHNNIASPLEISDAKLFYNSVKKWDLSFIDHHHNATT